MKRHPALLSYGTMTKTMSTVRDLPTTRDRLLYLAECAAQWRTFAARQRTDPRPWHTGDDPERWDAYADYLHSVGIRIMRYALARRGVRLDTYDPTMLDVLELDL